MGGLLAVVLTTAFTAPVSAHGGQNTTTAGEYELGIHIDPANPVVDTETESSATYRTRAQRKARSTLAASPTKQSSSPSPARTAVATG